MLELDDFKAVEENMVFDQAGVPRGVDSDNESRESSTGYQLANKI